MQKYFDIQQVHLEGKCDVSITKSGILYSIGQDDMIFRKDLNTKEEKREHLNSEQGSSYNTLAASDQLADIIVIGGTNKAIESIYNMDKDNIRFMYKFGEKISQVEISKQGTFLGVALNEQSAALYHFGTKKLVRCRPSHTECIVSVFFSNNEKYICSTGTDGKIRLYDLENWQSPSQKFNYKISNQFNRNSNQLQLLKGMFNSTDTIIACPGKPFLQIIQYRGDSFHQSYKMSISHSKDLNICHWQNQSVLVTGGMDVSIKVWNFQKEEELFNIQNIYFTRIASFGKTFYGINHSGSVYTFNQPQKIDIKPDPVAIIVQDSNEVQIIGPFKKIDLQNQDSQQSQKIIKKSNKSKADTLITQYPQEAINRVTQFHENKRFLLYNTVGAIIERSDDGNTTIEIEYHDSKIVNKNRTLFTDKQIVFSDLQVNRIAYANYGQYGYFGECSWKHEVETGEEVTGIALGNDWVAVSMETCLLIFDLAGNNVNNIAFDRYVVQIAAYENLLAVAYVDSIPMFGCQNLKMNIWNINGVNEPVQNIYIPLRPKSTLKFFGFSQQGLLYTQDSSEWVRVFSFESKKWIDIINPTDQAGQQDFRLWIVGFSGYELLAFKLGQNQYFPTVLPKMYPIKLRINVPNLHNRRGDDMFSNTKAAFGEIVWKKIVLQHERYRYKTWYRYKFSRSENSYNYARSASILSEQELNIKENALDLEFIFLIKNMLIQKQAEKALITCKSFIKSQKQIKKIADIFRNSQLPQLAQRLQQHYQQSKRLQQYDLAQRLKLKQLQQDMQMSINYKPIDPMNPKGKKSNVFTRPSATPLSQNLQTGAALIDSKFFKQDQQYENVNRNPFARSTPSEKIQMKQVFNQ